MAKDPRGFNSSSIYRDVFLCRETFKIKGFFLRNLFIESSYGEFTLVHNTAEHALAITSQLIASCQLKHERLLANCILSWLLLLGTANIISMSV